LLLAGTGVGTAVGCTATVGGSVLIAAGGFVGAGKLVAVAAAVVLVGSAVDIAVAVEVSAAAVAVVVAPDYTGVMFESLARVTTAVALPAGVVVGSSSALEPPHPASTAPSARIELAKILARMKAPSSLRKFCYASVSDWVGLCCELDRSVLSLELPEVMRMGL
jgi:hypothetical protein